jgi:alkylation response protein AidB-like acyl-CoA dehydrogenase
MGDQGSSARGRTIEHTPPSCQELLARAEALQPLLREHTAAGDADRRLPDEVIARLGEAGLFRMLTPRRLGGCETRLRTVVAVVETLAVADGSAAWLVALWTAHAWMAGLFSELAQQEIFGADPDALIAGRIVRVAGGREAPLAERVDGGLRIGGRFAYASGSHHARWVLLGARTVDETGVADVLICLAPTSELRVEDTWHTVGLRGTGSNTWIAEDLFVPEHRTISTQAMSDGMVSPSTDEPMYRLPVMSVATLMLLGPLLGLGEAALRLAKERAPARPLSDTTYHPKSKSVGIQVQVAEAALRLQTARLHAFQIADELDYCAAIGQTVDYTVRARMRAQSGHVAEQVIESINLLVNVHGAESFAQTSPMQRYWRDANIAARHAGLNALVGYEIFGRALLGVEEEISAIL